MQVQSLNAYVDVVRQEIIDRYQPGEDDPHLRILKAAHLDEDEYFSQLVSEDIGRIIRDIRTAHLGDSEGAPVNTVAEELRQDIEEVMNFKGSDLERQAILYDPYPEQILPAQNTRLKAEEAQIKSREPKFPAWVGRVLLVPPAGWTMCPEVAEWSCFDGWCSVFCF